MKHVTDCFHNSDLSFLQKKRACGFKIKTFLNLLILKGNHDLQVSKDTAEYPSRVSLGQMTATTKF